MSESEVSETCRCGAATTVKFQDRANVLEAIAAWRTPARQHTGTGAATTLGFASPSRGRGIR